MEQPDLLAPPGAPGAASRNPGFADAARYWRLPRTGRQRAPLEPSSDLRVSRRRDRTDECQQCTVVGPVEESQSSSPDRPSDLGGVDRAGCMPTVITPTERADPPAPTDPYAHSAKQRPTRRTDHSRDHRGNCGRWITRGRWFHRPTPQVRHRRSSARTSSGAPRDRGLCTAARRTQIRSAPSG
jgi:hypothetical protein